MTPHSEHRSRWATQLARLLDSRGLRMVVVGLVLVSVVPELHIGRASWHLFAAFFMAIALCRAVLITQKVRVARMDIVLLAADFLIALTFLPWELWTTWMTPERLHGLWVARLLVIIRPSQAFLEDLWVIMTRRERLQQFTSVSAAVVILSLLATALLLNLAPPYDYNGTGAHSDDSFLDVLWWSFRQLESADNLVPTLRNNPVMVLVSLGLTVIGVFIIAFIIGIGSSVVEQLVRAERRRPVDYKSHSVIIGPIHDAEVLVHQYVELHEKNRSLRRIGPREIWLWLTNRGPRPRRHALPRIALFGESREPPPFLYEPSMQKVLYRSGVASLPESLALVGAHRAKRVLVLAPAEHSVEADASSIAALGALRALTHSNDIYLELFDRNNHFLVEAIGGPRTVAIEVPRIIGQFLSAHLVVPGIDQLFANLLTASGSEIYTHILLEGWERTALQTWAEQEATILWRDLWRMARDHDVTMLGVILRPPGRGDNATSGGVPFQGLVPWLNPLSPPQDPSLQALDIRPGHIPLAHLAGLIGLSNTYREMKQLSRVLLRGHIPPSPAPRPEASHEAVLQKLSHDDGDLKRVLIVGESAALPALVQELAALVPGAELLLMLTTQPSSPPLRERLDGLALSWNDSVGDPLIGGVTVPLRRATSSLRILTASPRRVFSAAAGVWERIGPFEAAVFLGDGTGPDPDAAIGHRVLRFAQELAALGPLERPPHLLVEVHSTTRGQQITSDLKTLMGPQARFRVTPVSADRIRNYFMVHSAFVPGVDRIYGELLGEWGQDLMVLTWPGGDGTITWGDLVEALASRQILPIAYQLKGESPVVGPVMEAVVPLYRLQGVFALGEVGRSSPGHPPPEQATAPQPEDNT